MTKRSNIIDDTGKAEDVVQLVLDTAKALERKLDNALSFSRGITFSEYRLLRTLQDAEHGLTRVALAQLISVSPSGATRALKPLEKLGYVTTIKSDRDARQSLAVLSQGGRDLLADVSGVLRDAFNELAIESVRGQDLAALDRVLTQLRGPR